MIGRADVRRAAVAGTGWLALAATVVTLSACGESFEDFTETEHVVALQVRTAAGAPVAGVAAKAWIMDADLPAAGSAPIELEEQTTGPEGRVEWTYTALEQPYICGFLIRDAGGATLKEDSPASTERLNAATGVLTVMLD